MGWTADFPFEITQIPCRNVPDIRYIWAATWQNQQNKCAPSEDSDQTGDSAWADLSLRWAQVRFVGFVMSRLIFVCSEKRSCVDWWCAGDKATDTTPTKLPTTISTTLPPTTTTTTTPTTTTLAPTTLPPSVPDLDEEWSKFLEKLFGSGGLSSFLR